MMRWLQLAFVMLLGLSSMQCPGFAALETDKC